MSNPLDPNYTPRRWPDDFKEGWKAEIVTDGFRTRRLYISARGANRGPRVVLTSVTWAEVERGYLAPPSPFYETYEERADGCGEVTGLLQAIIDAAWDAGMRPSQQRDATEELKAVRYHLEDMRALAFGKEKP